MSKSNSFYGTGYGALLNNREESVGWGNPVNFNMHKIGSKAVPQFKLIISTSDVLRLRYHINTIPYAGPTQADRLAGIRALTALEGLYGLPDNASELQRRVVLALEDKGFAVETEATTRGKGERRCGRLDVLAEYKGGWVAIELDARSPRRKSLDKLRRFEAFRIIGLRGVSQEPPFGIDAVAMLQIGKDPTPDFELLLQSYPGRSDSRARKAAFTQFIARLRQGCDLAAMIAGMKRYAAWYAAFGGKQPDGRPETVASWLAREMWECPWDISNELQPCSEKVAAEA